MQLIARGVRNKYLNHWPIQKSPHKLGSKSDVPCMGCVPETAGLDTFGAQALARSHSHSFSPPLRTGCHCPGTPSNEKSENHISSFNTEKGEN